MDPTQALLATEIERVNPWQMAQHFRADITEQLSGLRRLITTITGPDPEMSMNDLRGLFMLVLNIIHVQKREVDRIVIALRSKPIGHMIMLAETLMEFVAGVRVTVVSDEAAAFFSKKIWVIKFADYKPKTDRRRLILTDSSELCTWNANNVDVLITAAGMQPVPRSRMMVMMGTGVHVVVPKDLVQAFQVFRITAKFDVPTEISVNIGATWDSVYELLTIANYMQRGINDVHMQDLHEFITDNRNALQMEFQKIKLGIRLPGQRYLPRQGGGCGRGQSRGRGRGHSRNRDDQRQSKNEDDDFYCED